MNTLEILDNFAKTHNCLVGICDASPLDEAFLSGFVPFVSKDIKKRTDPTAVLPNAKSVIVVGVGEAGTLPKPDEIPPGAPMAQLSSLGTNYDYHIRVKEILHKLVAALGLSSNYKILVDSPTLDERAFAKRAGIGFFGRNGLIVSQKFGSRFNIGLLVTDIPGCMVNMPASRPESCPPNCRNCITACPGKALQPGHPLDVSRCVSYLTQKKELTADDEALLMVGGQLYGCDICQDVCPFNHPREATYVNPGEWLNMSDSSFAEKYASTAMLWQGADILRRNARLICKLCYNLKNLKGE